MANCPCGLPLHYADAMIAACVQRSIDVLGPTLAVSTPAGTWAVPQHFLALHRFALSSLPRLARRYRWRQERGPYDQRPSASRREGADSGHHTRHRAAPAR